MAARHSIPAKHSVQTPSGRINYTEQGSGPVALFVHGVLLNGYLWRHQQTELSDVRRTIAIDLLRMALQKSRRTKMCLCWQMPKC